MNGEEPRLRNFVGQDLAGFKIIEMTEVYRVDEDGKYSISIGYFRNPYIAEAFAVNVGYLETRSVFVLTNTDICFLISDQTPIVTYSEEKAEAIRLRDVALGKLSLAERELLGLG